MHDSGSPTVAARVTSLTHLRLFIPKMGTFLSPRQALIMASIVVLVTLFTTTADAKDPKECPEFHLPRGIDLRTWKAKTDPDQRMRLIDFPARTAFVVIGAILIVLTNVCFQSSSIIYLELSEQICSPKKAHCLLVGCSLLSFLPLAPNST